MFYYIRGALVLLEASAAVIDAGGVGYRMTVSGNTRERLAGLDAEKKKNALLYTHLSVREDGIELFGFFDVEELNVFRLLIGVSGVGPKAAMSVLSFMTPEKLALAVSTDDRKAISRAPGIGPKTAARIVLELKDKLHGEAADDAPDDSPLSGEPSAGGKLAAATDALLVLGFSRASALTALRGIDIDSNELEDIIRLALKKLMK